METCPLRVLVVEHDAAQADAIRGSLAAPVNGVTFDMRTVETIAEYRRLVAASPPDIALINLHPPDGRAIDALRRPPERSPFPILILARNGNERTAVEMIKAGALNYVCATPEGIRELPQVINNALQEWRLLKEQERAEQELRDANRQLSAIIELLPDAAFVIDVKGAVIAWNKAIETLSGVHKEDMLGKGNYEYAIPFYGKRGPILIDLALLSDEDHVEWKQEGIQWHGNMVYGEVFVAGAYKGRGAYLWGAASPLRNDKGDVVGAIETIRDVSDRKKTERELELFKAVVEASGEAIAISDPNGKLLYVNRSYERLLGRSLEKAGRSSFLDHYPPESVDTFEQGIFPLLNRGEGWEGELETFDASGRRFPVWARMDSLLDASRSLLYGFGFMHDVSERKAAEAALRESEERYRAMFERNRAIKLLMDPKTGKIVDANPAACDFYGYSRAQLQRMSILDINTLPREHVLAAMEETRSCSQGVFQFQHRMANGAVRHVEVLASTIEIRGRELLFSVIHDITERKRIEDALQASEEKFRRLIENAPDAVFVEMNGCFAYVNPATLDLLGAQDAGALLGKSCIDRIHPSSRDAIREMLEQIRKEKRAAPGSEHKCLRLDGQAVDIETLAVPITYENREAALVFARNIGERKRTEEQRRRLEEQLQMMQKAESLGRMAGAVAHHFNNMLGAVMGNLELALDDLPPDSETYASVAAAGSAASRAADISRLMLAYLGQTLGERERFDLSVVCEDMAPFLRASLKRNVTLRVTTIGDGPLICANPVHTRQILTNLVTNAGESIGEEKGEIVIAVGIATARETAGGRAVHPPDWSAKEERYAYIEVWDTGSGIAPEIMGNIFDPFFTTKFTGRGLGLAVVLGLARAHAGVVTVDERPGGGAVFKVFLPLAEEEAVRPSESDTAASCLPDQEGTLILLVEDENIVLTTIHSMLKRLGYKVLTASNGDEALTLLRETQRRICCVLLDLMMPSMDGWETLAAMREIRSDLPVVLASGYDEATAMEGVQTVRPQAFLHKPYNKSDLRAAINLALRWRP